MIEPHLPQNKTVLIADDDDTVASFFHTLLIGEKFGTIIVNSGQDALVKLRATAPRKIDLLVLDLMMPTPGGYEVLKKMQSGGYQEVPVFVVTARQLDDQSIAMLKLESNVRSFWKKPIDQDEFIRQVYEATEAVRKS